jgi:hypothetical protein
MKLTITKNTIKKILWLEVFLKKNNNKVVGFKKPKGFFLKKH